MRTVFQKTGNKKLKEYFESKYRISWLNSPDDLPCTFGLPKRDFPECWNFQFLSKILETPSIFLMHLSEEHLPYGFFAVAQLTASESLL